MEKNTENQKPRERGVFDFIFPREYDFEQMLAQQAEMTLEGVSMLVQWLTTDDPLGEPTALVEKEEAVDAFRHDMEDKLVQSFSTPIDRQDIYTISRQMDYIINFAKETATEIHAFGVVPDDPITGMAEALLRGTGAMAAGVRKMHTDHDRVERCIRNARDAIHDLEHIYIDSMAALLNTDDAMGALKKREVYHHLRDAGRALRTTVDTLHTAVVGLM